MEKRVDPGVAGPLKQTDRQTETHTHTQTHTHTHIYLLVMLCTNIAEKYAGCRAGMGSRLWPAEVTQHS